MYWGAQPSPNISRYAPASSDKTTYGSYRPNDTRPTESVCLCGADGYGDVRRHKRRSSTTTGFFESGNDPAFPFFSNRESNASHECPDEGAITTLDDTIRIRRSCVFFRSAPERYKKSISHAFRSHTSPSAPGGLPGAFRRAAERVAAFRRQPRLPHSSGSGCAYKCNENLSEKKQKQEFFLLLFNLWEGS